MKSLFVGGGIVLVASAIAVVVGYLLPVGHTSTRSVRLRVSKEELWHLITDFGNSINRLEEGVEYETVELNPGKKLVRRIATKNLPFGGSWTYEIVQDRQDSVLTITENGEVYNPFFRFISRFVFGHAATIERYLKNVKSVLGEA